MEILASVLAVIIAFIALWMAADSQGRSEHQFRALLDSRVLGLKKEIAAAVEMNQASNAQIAQLQKSLLAMRNESHLAVQAVAELSQQVSAIRNPEQPAAPANGRRRS